MFGITLFTLTLVAMAGLANSVMDTLRYRFEGSLFEKLAAQRNSVGSFFKVWAGPQSHLNKYWLDTYPVLGPLFGWLFHGPLAFTASLWQFSRFVMLSSLQLAIIGPLFFLGKLTFIQGIWFFIAMKFAFGLVFELFFPDYENDRRELWEVKFQSFSRMALPRFKGKGVVNGILLTAMLGAVLVYQLLGGQLGEGFGFAELAALGSLALGWGFVWWVRSEGVRRMAT